MRRRTFIGLIAALCLLCVVPDPSWAARQFNGTTDKGDNSNALAGVSTTGSFTISVWAWADSTSAGAHNVFASGSAGSYSVQLRRDGSDWNVYTNPLRQASFAGGVTSGVWTHLAATDDGTNLKLYVNGVLKATTLLGGVRVSNGSVNSIGYDAPDTGQFWDGRIAELAIWSIDVGATVIARLAAANVNDAARSEITGPGEYWPLRGTASPEPNTQSSFVWTLTGTSKAADPFGTIFLINGAETTSLAVSSRAITLPATVAGNDLIVFAGNGDNAPQAVTSVVAAGATFTFLASKVNGTARLEAWIARGVAAGITTVTVTWAAAPAAVSIETVEYLGVRSIGQAVTASGSTANPTISLTTQDASNVVVAGFVEVGATPGPGVFQVASAGIFRFDTLSAPSDPVEASGVIDNGSATPAAVTCTMVEASTFNWAAVAVELRTGTTRRRVMSY